MHNYALLFVIKTCEFTSLLLLLYKDTVFFKITNPTPKLPYMLYIELFYDLHLYCQISMQKKQLLFPALTWRLNEELTHITAS